MSAPQSRARPPVVVQVRGDAALFTRPELRVERVSYPVMTPTAAVGVLEAIFWKPEFRWVPVRIEVLRPVEQFMLRRNETHDLPSLADAVGKGKRVDTVANRDQRSALCLRDVEYRIHAHIELAVHADKPEAAYRDQFRRRVNRGACYQRPFLGAREFPAEFFAPDQRAPIAESMDLGVMLHRVHYGPPARFDFFTARLERGVLHVPAQGIPGAGDFVAGVA
ncbi:type I-C CRISPR-associated protein Cas5 [Actinoplanes sp. TBRC 11911]|uniref:type I-C CRISPR-associated protein Cas5c n=1 Tax=Actinoplanes sp. TBRC 11911 TaxID=2729386 RepID=UPI00145F74CE|nr:type I-C CRISPR-associated protein Cas5c [Actinoplanes sp. TBRC 11911]NMO56064.1 type I-C CRISPR-associated protein Cas5 [Actinoplanes sp. TBRC 11911]